MGGPRRRSQSVPAVFCIYGLFCQGHSAVNETKHAIVFHSAATINYTKAYFGGIATALAAAVTVLSSELDFRRRLSSSRPVSQVTGTTLPSVCWLRLLRVITYSFMPMTAVEALARNSSSPPISGFSPYLLCVFHLQVEGIDLVIRRGTALPCPLGFCGIASNMSHIPSRGGVDH